MTMLVDRRYGTPESQRCVAIVRPSRRPPLWPWRAALRRAGLEIAYGSDVEPAAAASTRFAALARMSDVVLAADRTVIVLEDLHWADTPSRDAG